VLDNWAKAATGYNIYVDMKTIPVILAVTPILIALALITAGALVTPAFALKRYFNCVAANHGKAALEDVDRCFRKEFHSSSGK
jgi:hypothetical protein